MLTQEQINAIAQRRGENVVSPMDVGNVNRAEELKSAWATSNKEPGYIERVGSDLSKTAQDITSSVNKLAQGPGVKEGDTLTQELTKGVEYFGKTVPEAALRTVGGIARTPFDIIGELPGVKQTLDKIGSLIGKVPGVKEVVEKAGEIAQKHPDLAKDVQNVVDIAAFGSGGIIEKPIQKISGETIKKGGEIIEKGAIRATDIEKQKFVRELVRPEQTKAIKEAQVARTTEKGKGIFKRSEIKPTPQDLESEKAILEIPGVSKSKTVQQNYNIIKKYNSDEASRLEESIKVNDFKVPKGESIIRIERARADLMESPLITGDAEKTAAKLINGAKKFIEKNSETGSGLLEARKQYDIWVKAQKPNAFGDKLDAFNLANREIRKAMNDLLEEKAPQLKVKDSLHKQSALFNAMENLTPKAAQEADTAIGRTMQNIGKVLGTKNKVVQAVAAAAGIGGLGAAATFAPAVAIAGVPTYLIWKGGKFILKPSVRKAIGELLETAGKKISEVDRNYLTTIVSDYTDEQQ